MCSAVLVVHVDIPDNRTPTVTARSPEHSGAPRDHGSRPRETLRRYLSLIYIIIQIYDKLAAGASNMGRGEQVGFCGVHF